jgi:hypothetical protein
MAHPDLRRPMARTFRLRSEENHKLTTRFMSPESFVENLLKNPSCGCAELSYEKGTGRDKRKIQIAAPNYPGVGKHDCAEVRRRNQFIGVAQARAMQRAYEEGEKKGSARFGARFTFFFSREMDRLCSGK